MPSQNADAQSCVMSYLSLRKAIGYIGLALPFVLVIGKWILEGFGAMQPSISDYYYTDMRNVFVGALCAIGVFLMSYRGYEKADHIAGYLASGFAIGVALFPAAPSNPSATSGFIGHVHLTFAAAFFLTLAYISLALFTKTHANKSMTARKRTRNTVYRVCGWTIVGSIALVVIDFAFFKNSAIQGLHPVLALESIMVWAFGISWLVKGEAILADIEAPHRAATRKETTQTPRRRS